MADKGQAQGETPITHSADLASEIVTLPSSMRKFAAKSLRHYRQLNSIKIAKAVTWMWLRRTDVGAFDEPGRLDTAPHDLAPLLAGVHRLHIQHQP